MAEITLPSLLMPQTPHPPRQVLEVVAETTAPLQSYAELLESIESDVDPVGLEGRSLTCPTWRGGLTCHTWGYRALSG